MKRILPAIACLFGLVIAPGKTAAEDSISAQVVAEYPDLAKPDSPLHREYVKVRNRMRAAASPVFQHPQASMIVAPSAAAELRLTSESGGVRLQRTRIVVPGRRLPGAIRRAAGALSKAEDLTEEAQARWKRDHPAIDLAVSLWVVPLAMRENPAAALTGPLGELKGFVERMMAALETQDLAKAREFTAPELRSSLVQFSDEKKPVIAVKPTAPVTLLLFAELDGGLVMFWKRADGVATAAAPLLRGDQWFLGPPVVVKSDELLRSLLEFLNEQSPEKLIPEQ